MNIQPELFTESEQPTSPASGGKDIDHHGMPHFEPWYDPNKTYSRGEIHGPFTVRHRTPEERLRVSDKGPLEYPAANYRFYTGQFIDPRDGSVYDLSPRIASADATIKDILSDKESDKIMILHDSEYVISTEPKANEDTSRTGGYYVFKAGLGMPVKKQDKRDHEFVGSPNVEHVDPELKAGYKEALIHYEKRQLGITRGVGETVLNNTGEEIRHSLKNRKLEQ